jgi:hypothetical protein
MNRLARIQPRQWLFIALVLIATGVLTFLLRDTVREAVVIPLTYAVWLGDRMLSSLPQGMLLGVLLVLGAGILVRSATRSTEPAQEVSGYAPAPAEQRHSRLVFWARQLNRMEDSQFAVEKLAVELKALTVKILSAQENLPDDEVIDAVKRGTLAVPAEVRDLILRPQDWMTAHPPSQWQLFLRWLRRNQPEAPANDPQSAKLEAVIRFIETRVETRVQSEQP